MKWNRFGKKHIEFLDTPLNKHKKIVILSGSVRSGKTVAMIPKWLEFIQSVEGLKLIIGVSKDTVYDNVLNDLFDTLGANNYTYNRTTGELKIKINDGWTVCKVIGAKDEGSEKYLRGKTIAGAYVDEGTLIPQSFFKQLLNRCSVEGAKIFITTNPDSPLHYLYREYITNIKKQNIVEVWEFFLDDNPNLTKEYIDFITNAYSGIEYDRFIKGLWKITEGLICRDFSEDNKKHINYLPKEPLLICCDFNVDPMCWVLAHKTTNSIYFFDEIVQENTTTEKCIAEFIRRYPNHQSDIYLMGDYSGSARNVGTEKHNYDQMQNALITSGIPASKIHLKIVNNPDVVWRIASLNNKIKKISGEIGFYINADKCPITVGALETIQWGLDNKPKKFSDKDKKSNLFVKAAEHIFDAIGYPVFFFWAIKRNYLPSPQKPLTTLEQWKKQR